MLVSGPPFLDVELHKEDNKVGVIDKSTEESLAIARVETCPVCFGEDLCTEIQERFLTVSIFGEVTPYGTIYQVFLLSDH